MVGVLRVAIIAFGLLVGAAPAAAAPCYNVTKGEPRSLTGLIEYVIFPGPPNFENIQKGDAPEPTFLLRLSTPICITGDDFTDPHKTFRSVHVVETEATAGRLRHFVQKMVTLTLTQQMSAETGHHHAPLVVWATSVESAVTHPMEVIEEYGTAATTIRAFYSALGDGQGAVASSLIVPEKRHLPAFSPAGLTQFYGSLRHPIRLIEITRENGSAYTVHYRYRSSSRPCDGRAVVTTTTRRGRFFIVSIRTLSGC